MTIPCRQPLYFCTLFPGVDATIYPCLGGEFLGTFSSRLQRQNRQSRDNG
nr:MAG TPA: hypothetical protein [Caudoviricetes sp.]DAU81328.1 MAG TPA: hypothetical protein [Caudoviricetes sp.]